MKPETIKDNWLLEVGVLGVDKTRLWMKKTGRTLLELEHILRRLGVDTIKYGEKQNLPYRNIPPSPLGISGGHDEYMDMRLALEDDEDKKKDKGKKDGKARASLSRWLMDAKTLNIILNGSTDSDDKKRISKIKAASQILGDALCIINKQIKRIPPRYPKSIEKYLDKNARSKIMLILKLDKETHMRRSARYKHHQEVYEKQLEDIQKQMETLNFKRLNTISRLNQYKAVRKKWGE